MDWTAIRPLGCEHLKQHAGNAQSGRAEWWAAAGYTASVRQSQHEVCCIVGSLQDLVYPFSCLSICCYWKESVTWRFISFSNRRAPAQVRVMAQLLCHFFHLWHIWTILNESLFNPCLWELFKGLQYKSAAWRLWCRSRSATNLPAPPTHLRCFSWKLG